MSASASRLASRGAGRGAILRSQRDIPPSTPLSTRRKPSSRPANAGRGSSTNLNRSPAAAPTALSTSILQQRAPFKHSTHRASPHQSHAEEPFYAREGHRNNRVPERARSEEDWYSSAARAEALEGMAHLSQSLRTNIEVVEQRPFAWADFSAVAGQVPSGHWAHEFLHGVAQSLEANAGLDGQEKQQVLSEVLETLSGLSKTEQDQDERFQDAAEGR